MSTHATINPDGTPVLIEAVFYRHFGVYRHECDSVEEAINFIEYGEDDGFLSSVGVFVDGEPRIYDGFLSKEPPSPEQADAMIKSYTEASEF